MATLNSSHHENGGVILYSGEFILLYCDSVNCDVEGKGFAKGRIYLTTHRFIFTAQPLKQHNGHVQSLSAPFFTMYDLSLEQPVFSANYIKGKVRASNNQNNSFYAFKLKFGKGGAIEFGQAMTVAARQLSNSASTYQPPPSYETATSYYEAPQSVYQPDYPVGFSVPTQMFPQPPPAGFVFMSQAPPPYPGLTTLMSQQTVPGIPSDQYVATPTTVVGFVVPAVLTQYSSYTSAGSGPQTYPPSQPPAYTPETGSYAPSSGGYPSTTPGYPIPSAAYTPTSAGYPHTSGLYPPTSSGYPPNATVSPSFPSVYPTISGGPPGSTPYSSYPPYPTPNGAPPSYGQSKKDN